MNLMDGIKRKVRELILAAVGGSHWVARADPSVVKKVELTEKELIEMVEALINTAAGRWRKASEKEPPKDGTRFLAVFKRSVRYDHEFPRIVYWVRYMLPGYPDVFEKWKQDGDGFFEDGDRIFAWAPLNPPPKEERCSK